MKRLTFIAICTFFTIGSTGLTKDLCEPKLQIEGATTTEAIQRAAQLQFGTADRRPSVIALGSLFSDFRFKKFLQYQSHTNEILAKVRELPAADRQIIVYHLPQSGRSKSAVQFTPIPSAFLKATQEAFASYSRFELVAVAIPSVAVMQTVLDVQFGDNAMKLKPVYGLSSVEDRLNDYENGFGDLIIQKPSGAPITAADDSDLGAYGVTYHDFFHAYVNSQIPRNVRGAIAHLAKLVLAEAANPANRVSIDLARKFVTELMDYRPLIENVNFFTIIAKAFGNCRNHSEFRGSKAALADFIIHQFEANSSYWYANFSLDVTNTGWTDPSLKRFRATLLR